MAWWQKKLLHYALTRTGLLDDHTIDLKDLDITLGRRNVVELKNVGLNIKRISKLAQMPPGLRVETARILLLRLIVPADIYQSSIVAEVDGVELSLRLDEQHVSPSPKKQRARSPVTTRAPQHRKVQRRWNSPPPYDPDGLSDSDDSIRIPTTHELAKSFLLDEPLQEQQDMAASVAVNATNVQDSAVSESSGSDDAGIGTTIGLPGFLAGFLEGVVDRLQVVVKNVDVRLTSMVAEEGQSPSPATLRLRVGSVEFKTCAGKIDDGSSVSKREFRVDEITLDLLLDSSRVNSLSSPTRASSIKSSKQQSPTRATERSIDSVTSTTGPGPFMSPKNPRSASETLQDALSAALEEDDRFADARTAASSIATLPPSSELDIQPGDDNISWGSRRSKTSAPTEDLWSSMASEDQLPESLLLDNEVPRTHTFARELQSAARTRRNVSPYSRTIHSSGPQLRHGETLADYRSPLSPGSWPALDQSQQTMFQSVAPEMELLLEDPMDNKQTALAMSIDAAAPSVGTEVDIDDAQSEDIAQSRVYTHEEAESMYMSAMTHEFKPRMPGGWGSEYAQSERSVSPEVTRRPMTQGPIERAESIQDPTLLDPTHNEQQEQVSGNVTPRPRSPEPPVADNNPEEGRTRTTIKHIMYIDYLSGSFPNGSSDAEVETTLHKTSGESERDMPGTFSAYSEMAASQRKPHGTRSRSRGPSIVPKASRSESNSSYGPQVALGSLVGQVDVGVLRILSRMLALRSIFGQGPKTVETVSTPQEAASDNTSKSLIFSSETIYFSVVESVAAYRRDCITDPGLLSLELGHLVLTTRNDETKLDLGSIQILLGAQRLLAFDAPKNQDASLILTEMTPDVTVSVRTNSSTARGAPITEVNTQTMVLAIFVDLDAIDEALGCLGGVSGVLELSQSILSDTSGASPQDPSSFNKGVRFEVDHHATPPQPELKANVRMAGTYIELRGRECTMQLRTTTLKAVYREHGTIATVDHVTVSGPYITGVDHDASIQVSLTTLRFEFSASPQEKDLDRLLSLLTPSKDKYDNDDDILIDTLLRQRRKGSVLRVAFGRIKVKVADYLWLQQLTALGGELTKLSVVVKYLPEDERPGLLALLKIKDFEASLPTNERLGKLRIGMQDFHCAQVGLPALLALSVSSLHMCDDRKAPLLQALLSDGEHLPMLMVRMLGDEAEPTIKIKLYNLCAEYSVPMLVALTSVDTKENIEAVVVELAQSVVFLAESVVKANQTISSSPRSKAPERKTQVNVLVHSCALRMTPQRLTSRAFLVLTDARFTTALPPGATLVASLDIRKASIAVTDGVTPANDGQLPIRRPTVSMATPQSRVNTHLLEMGYVVVGSIMSATLEACIEHNTGSGADSVVVDVKNELFLLETCADSTQTLIATLADLVPPTAPSSQPKYLREALTVDDMMASFSGEPVPASNLAAPVETLFDADETLLQASTLGDEPDDFMLGSQMTSSLYGPGSQIHGGSDDGYEDFPSNDDDDGTAESLLEDDPFEMTLSPTDTSLSDAALMRELSKQCKPPKSDTAVELDLYEIEDLGLDALHEQSQILGAQHRFNTPGSRRLKLPSTGDGASLPFRLRLHDTHVIWNMYDGYDWQSTREGITSAVEQVEAKAEDRKARHRQSLDDRDADDGVIGDLLFNSIYIGVPTGQDAQDLRRRINHGIDDQASETESVPLSGMSRPTSYSGSGRQARPRQRRRLKLNRSRTHKIAFELKGLSVDVSAMPPDIGAIVSSIDIRANSFEIFDNVPTSTWRKFLTRRDNDSDSMEMSKPMMHIALTNVRTLQDFGAAEIIINVRVLPLRLHVDQDALDFITRFFEFKDQNAVVSEDISEKPFLQRIEVETVDLRMDYKPKYIDYGGLRSGKTTEFMNFVSLDAADIKLKHAIVYGLRGFEPLHDTLNGIWMPDVKRNQLPTILAGLGPVRSLVNIGAGVRDVVAIPIREYRKDGRIVRSIQKGAFHFGKTTASELARFGAKVAIGTQTILEGAEELLSPATASSSSRPSVGRRISSDPTWQDFDHEEDEREPRSISAYANQPANVFAGLRSAQSQLEHDLLTAKGALIAVQGEIMDGNGPGAAASAIARHAPIVLLRPVIGGARALGTALLGVGNQIDRSNLRRVEDVSSADVTQTRSTNQEYRNTNLARTVEGYWRHLARRTSYTLCDFRPCVACCGTDSRYTAHYLHSFQR